MKKKIIYDLANGFFFLAVIDKFTYTYMKQRNHLLIQKIPKNYITFSLISRAVVLSLNCSGSSKMHGRSLKGGLAHPTPPQLIMSLLSLRRALPKWWNPQQRGTLTSSLRKGHTFMFKTLSKLSNYYWEKCGLLLLWTRDD